MLFRAPRPVRVRKVGATQGKMAKKMLIDATHAEETRVVVVDGNKVEEFDFESENKRQLAGNIYLAKVTRVEPSLQAAFVDYGGNRHGFLAFSEIHPDYYQIPVADREMLMEEERAYAEAMRARDDEEEETKQRKSRSRGRGRSRADKSATKAARIENDDLVETKEVDISEGGGADAPATEISGMETIDLRDDQAVADVELAEVPEGATPVETGVETPVGERRDATAAEVDDPAETAPTEALDISEAVETTAQTIQAEPDGDAVPSEATGTTEDGVSASDAIVADVASEEAAAEVSSDISSESPDGAVEINAVDEAKEALLSDGDPADEPDEGTEKEADAASKDDSIESVADEDDSEDIRPVRKPRPRRYKIQEVIKVRQVLLVQVVKEERGNKGAALTTYLSLAGRYCVLMPNTARGGGISRKITNAADRKKLKEIATEMDVPTGAGLIVRTAGAKRTKSEIKRDYEYLQRMWEQIRELTLKSIAPAKIYEEGDLIKRSIRDLYSREIDEVLVEGDRGYRNAKDFMKMIMPSHAKHVKNYQDQLPLFARFQVETYLGGMFNPTVQLKSGGYIVIGVTEALVAIDVSSGRATKEGSIEETALKTNLEAADEVARQLRLRDLAGLIVIDFIDMDERKNNTAVEKRMKDKLKTDRARIQVGRISGFGLMEMSRQRLRPGMIEATTQPCPHCHGTGLIRSDDSMALSVLRQIEEEGTRGRSREVLVKCPVDIANYLMNQKREHIAQIEARYGMSVRIEGDPHLVSPDFSIEKFKTASRKVQAVPAAVVSVDASLMSQVDSDEREVEEETEADAHVPEAVEATESEEDGDKKKRRRRRRRRRKGGNSETTETVDNTDAASEGTAGATEAIEGAAASEGGVSPVEEDDSEAPKKRKRTRTRSRSRKQPSHTEAPHAEGTEPDPTAPHSGEATTETTSDVEQAKDADGPSIPDAVEAEMIAPAAAEAEAVSVEAIVEVAEAHSAEAQPAQAQEVADAIETAAEEAAEATEKVAVAEIAVETPVAEDLSEDVPDQEALAEATERVAAPAHAETALEKVAEPAGEAPAVPTVEEVPKPKRRGWWSVNR